METSITPRRLCQGLVAMVSCLTLIGGVVQFCKHTLGYGYVFGLHPLFDLASDNSFPTWYASLTLLLCSVLLAIIFCAKKSTADPFTFHWAVMSAIFLCLSIDEVARIHERSGKVLRSGLIGETHGLLYYPWVILGGAFVIIVAAAYLKFLAHLPAKTRRLFILAGSVYVAGAIGVEMVNARYDELYGNQNLTYQLMTVAEEFLEMAGVVIFIYALTSYMAPRVRAVKLKLAA